MKTWLDVVIIVEIWSWTPDKFGHRIGIPSSNSRWLRHPFHQSSNLAMRRAVIGPIWIEIHNAILWTWWQRVE